MGEIGTTRNVTALRALNMAMSLVAVISLGSFAYGVIAVGTLITERPPHRSEHALLTHSAPTSSM
jgi:hypothetical protein